MVLGNGNESVQREKLTMQRREVLLVLQLLRGWDPVHMCKD